MAEKNEKKSSLGTYAEAVAPAPAPLPASVERLFMVMDDFAVPRGGGTFLLRKGKVISSRGYNVKELVELGVKLKEEKAKEASA